MEKIKSKIIELKCPHCGVAFDYNIINTSIDRKNQIFEIVFRCKNCDRIIVEYYKTTETTESFENLNIKILFE